ncbi:hypothetical protein OAE39_01825 [Akkermansiaceae bacterium]|nr:hypothetical protein [Akkermansiaceae bacterium]
MKLFLFLILTAPMGAQILGVFESFTKQENGESWAFYNYGTDEIFNAPWGLLGSENSEIYAIFSQGSGVSLYADSISSGGNFVGNYSDTEIDTIRCDVFVEDINSFSDAEFYILAGGTFYYSDFYVIEESGWSGLQSSLSDDQWYIFDDEDGEFIPVNLTSTILSDVSEVGLNFYPISSAADGRAVALDNFTLLPDLTTPEVSISTENESAEISFTGIEGIQYTVQTANNLQESSWTNVGSPFEIVGESTTIVPMVNEGFFRISSQPFFVETP